jgi:glycosyltransferase involved in cell wall biosynthesis
LNTYFSKNDLLITIINDCSTDNQDYDDIKILFNNFYDIEILKTPINSGPGIARQYGLDHMSRQLDYITFIDAGDIIYSSFEFVRYLNMISNNPDVLVFSAAHQTEEADGSIVYTDAFN